jgi:hypothetical protein
MRPRKRSFPFSSSLSRPRSLFWAVVEVQLVIQAMAAMAPMVNVAAALPEAEALVVAEELDVKAQEKAEA